jgi:hypothetical protein
VQRLIIVLQFLAITFVLGALALITVSAVNERWFFAMANLALLIVNTVLFFVLQRIKTQVRS